MLGLDVSERMLNQAYAMTNDAGIVYQAADLETLTLPAASIDVAYSSLTLHYLRHIDRLFATLFQALVPGGTLLFSAEHPIFTAPRQPGWRFTDDGQRTWPVDQYQQQGERLTHWFAEGVRKQHRTLGCWINTLIASGFVIQHLNEWGPTERQGAAQPALAEERERPMLFLLAAQKPA